jgi:hypothetical protein
MMTANRERREAADLGAGNVTELPIIVEVSPWIGLIFGAGVITLALRLAWNVIRSVRTGDMSAMTARQGVAVLVTLGVGLVLILRDVVWQLRLDETGIVLHAPFDLQHHSGQIVWTGLVSAHVVIRRRGSSDIYELSFTGVDGTVIALWNADRLPEQFGLALQALIVERAPRATDGRNIAGQLADVRRNAQAALAPSYRARDGHGEPLW